MTGTEAITGSEEAIQGLVQAALRGELSESDAEVLAQAEPTVVKFFALAAAERIAELQAKLDASGRIHPSTPSGQIPPYGKPGVRRRRKRPGAKEGHPGVHRPAPVRIDRREEHRLEVCPDCGGPLQRCRRVRRRIIEDIPQDIATEVVEHTIHRDYCPACKRHVEPAVPDALPGAMIGHRTVALTSWLHYGLGMTSGQIVELVGGHLRTHLSAGGLVSAWHRLGEVLEDWYKQIAEQARSSAVLHADETGWRNNGHSHWLWCFASQDTCYYVIDRSRGEPALGKFFKDSFDGVLVHDFWAAYDAVQAQDHQCCLVHLLRELEKVDQINASEVWRAFAKRLRRLIHDGIRLRKRADFDPRRYGRLIERIDRRLMELAHGAYGDADADRLAKRLLRYCDSLFTFLDRPEAPFENNLAERMIRPAVVMRKNIQSNRSDKGTVTQGVLMSVYRTLKLRGHDPLHSIAQTLRTYLATGHLPPLPVQFVADG